MPINGYFDTIFATAGDVTGVPDPTQSNGTVSYNQGFPVSYSTPVSSGGYNFPRGSHNQILKDITSAIQFLQRNGASNFITSVMNGGSPYSYNLGAVVMFDAGSGLQAWISTAAANTTTPGAMGADWNELDTGSGRLRLTGNTTFFVATTGNDSTGTGASGEPWLTMQHAYNYIAGNIDIAGFTCIIQVDDGTYASGLNATVPTVGGFITLQGNLSTPANCVISSGGSPCIAAYDDVGIIVGGGFELTGSSYLLMARGAGAKVTINGVMNYGTGGGDLLGQINAFWSGYVEVNANYTISGGAGQHYYASGNGIIEMGTITVTVSGGPTFSGQFALVSANATLQVFANTYTGSASGVRYLADTNATIGTNGGGANFFPGNSAGSTTNGGVYT